MSVEPKALRRRFWPRFHLASAGVMMLVASLLVGANLLPRNRLLWVIYSDDEPYFKKGVLEPAFWGGWSAATLYQIAQFHASPQSGKAVSIESDLTVKTAGCACTYGWPLNYQVSFAFDSERPQETLSHLLQNLHLPGPFAPIELEPWFWQPLVLDVVALLVLCAVSGALTESWLRRRRARDGRPA